MCYVYVYVCVIFMCVCVLFICVYMCVNVCFVFYIVNIDLFLSKSQVNFLDFLVQKFSEDIFGYCLAISMMLIIFIICGWKESHKEK